MLPVRSIVLLLAFLTGCTAPHGAWPGLTLQWPSRNEVVHASSSERYGTFNFNWQLSGDPEIMPVQVFDDGSSMWLQFPSQGAWPAVFEVGPVGLRPLQYRHEGPYMVIHRVFEHLELRGGHLRGEIRRTGLVQPTPPTESPSIALAAPQNLAESIVDTAVLEQTPLSLMPPPSVTAPALIGDIPGTEVSVQHDLAPEPAPVPAPVPQFSVSPADLTMRQALERWASLAGWMFAAEHWAVDVDIPLAGEAAFDTDFKSAVRDLLAATELGDRPLQPCFYSNRVLRVVPYAQPCDRSKGIGVLS